MTPRTLPLILYPGSATLLAAARCPLSGTRLPAGTVVRVERIGPPGFITATAGGWYFVFEAGEVAFAPTPEGAVKQ